MKCVYFQAVTWGSGLMGPVDQGKNQTFPWEGDCMCLKLPDRYTECKIVMVSRKRSQQIGNKAKNKNKAVLLSEE